MKTYFIFSDVHSFYSILKDNLEKNNFEYDNKDHKLVVYAELANGDVYDSYTLSGREIVIYYQPITYLSASTETPYVTGVASPIDFTFNSNTKAHMLTQAYVEANSSSFTATSTNNASVSWRYNPDGVLVGANVTLSNQQDSTISFNILGVKANITIFYDSEIVSSFADVTNTSDLYWIKLLRFALGQSYNIGNSLTKSQASKISLIDTTNYLSIVYNQLTEQQISTPQNFEKDSNTFPSLFCQPVLQPFVPVLPCRCPHRVSPPPRLTETNGP